MTISVSKPPSSAKLAISYDAEKNKFSEVRITEDRIIYTRALQSRLEATHIPSDNETPSGQLSVLPYHLDLHRYIGRIWSPFNDPNILPMSHEFSGMAIDQPANVREDVVKNFIEAYGDFFSYDITRDDFKTRSTANWRNEWQIIGEAALDLDTFTPEGINDKLAEFATPAIELNQIGESASIIIRPKGWAGFCWGLIARDKYDGITYERCANPKGCTREIPSLPPFGKSGRKQKFCSNRCKMADRSERQKKAINFQDVSADFQEWLRDEDRSR